MSQSNETNSEVREFIGKSKTVILSTVSQQGDPNASYAPFVMHQNDFYILISGLAKHTSNLLSTGRCHAMFIADEKDSVNLFARKRVSYACEVSIVARNDELANTLLEKLLDRFGPTIGTLASLPDFQLIRLSPGSGVWVRGFAQAIPIQGLE